MDIDYSDILITNKKAEEYSSRLGLKKVLSGFHLWGIGVGTVISAVFLGWNRGLEAAGPGGLLIAMLFVSLYFMILVPIFSELSSYFPFAGGFYAYARKGLGTFWGYLAGTLTIIQFVCASSAMVLYMSTYLKIFTIPISPNIVALIIFTIFIMIDIAGVRVSALIQFTLTAASVSALILFFMGTSVSFQPQILVHENLMPNGWYGVIFAIPIALWFYICITGISVAAEETKNPETSVFLGYITSLITVIILSFSAVIFCITVVDWRSLIEVDRPLNFVLSFVQSGDRVLSLVFSALFFCALFAALHGMISCFSRQTFALSRAGYLPKALSKIHPATKAPYMSILFPGLLAMLLSTQLSLGALISLVIYSALSMHVIVLFSYLEISNKEPNRTIRKRFRKKILVWIALLMTLFILIIYTSQAFRYIPELLFTLLIVSLYYLVIGKNYICDDAPEEIEAKLGKIYTKGKMDLKNDISFK